MPKLCLFDGGEYELADDAFFVPHLFHVFGFPGCLCRKKFVLILADAYIVLDPHADIPPFFVTGAAGWDIDPGLYRDNHIFF